MSDDARQLDLLALFHLVLGGVIALFSCMPFMHVFMGLAIVSGKFFEASEGRCPPPPMFGWMFVIMGSVFILLGWGTALFIFLAGQRLKKRQHRTFCIVMAGIECAFMPLGTVLGVFTLIALTKDSVRALFDEGEASDDVADHVHGNEGTGGALE